ncbi:T9SS type B sorting domain-containing protein [Neolewinella antarctica]|uniref:Gliding motility-associated-like protein n=1 Tax=Neolewinella antarctica TaxID=442734 RepID=A0ABX0X8J8_9BACT|nr:gliding motility-associated C-terminal domain-containing protein [Neolewinella antarctica]NJC25570.1 gliding motility-associated-like protein [Neolewinella antarctica]
MKYWILSLLFVSLSSLSANPYDWGGDPGQWGAAADHWVNMRGGNTGNRAGKSTATTRLRRSIGLGDLGGTGGVTPILGADAGADIEDGRCGPGNYTAGDGGTYYITQDTVIEETYVTAAGLDSTQIYRVQVLPNVADSLVIRNYRESTFTTEQGTYFIFGNTRIKEFYVAANGCDSTVVYQIFEPSIVVKATEETVCGPSPFDTGQDIYYITQDTTVRETFFSADGGDSVRVFLIVLLDVPSEESFYDVCQFQTFITESETYVITQDTIIKQRFLAANNCDSFHTYNVTALLPRQDSFGENLCEPGEFMTDRDTFYITQDTIISQTYVADDGCVESVSTYTVTVGGFRSVKTLDNLCEPDVFTTDQDAYFITQDTIFSETYALPNGCDSIHNYTVTVGGFDTEQPLENLCEPGDFITAQDVYFITQDTSFSETYVAANGCDSVLAYVVTVGGEVGQSLNNLCDPRNFMPAAQNYFITQDTSFTETYVAANGCDSVHTYVVTVGGVKKEQTSAKLCEAEVYSTNQRDYFITQDTSFTEAYLTTRGCDSIQTYNVTINAPIIVPLSDKLCEPESYTTDQATYFITQDTSFSETYEAANGCDSVRTYVVAVGGLQIVQSTPELCQPEFFLTDQDLYFITQDTSFTETYLLASGCDSIHTYLVTVGGFKSEQSSDHLCEPGEYTSDQLTYFITKDTIFSETYVAANGCDSLQTYVVTVGAEEGQTFQNLCEPADFMPNGLTYFITQDTVFDETLVAANGCDSVQTYNITVGGLKLTDSKENLCQPELYVTDQGPYFITQDTSFKEVYPIEGGCDSIHTYNITVGGFRSVQSETLLCEASSFVTDQGRYYVTQDTSFVETYVLASTCDSVHTYVITIGYVEEVQPAKNLCEPQTYTPNERSYYITQDTSFTETYQAANGCDSVLIHNVTVGGRVVKQTTDNLCEPGQYAVDARDYYVTQDTSITEVYLLPNGCDSIHTYFVTVGGLRIQQSTDNLCQPEVFVTDQGSYYITQDTSFTEVYPLPSGCDSIHTHNVTVGGFRAIASEELLCEASDFITDQGTYFITQDTSFTETYTLANSCDSVHTYLVTIGRVEVTLPPINLCEPGPFEPNELSYFITQDTSFTETYVAANGCDSVQFHTVTVSGRVVRQSTDNLCEPGPFTIDARDYYITQDTSVTEVYILADGCDSIHTYFVTVGGLRVKESTENLCQPELFVTGQESYYITQDTSFTEVYSLPSGCDSIHTHNITVGGYREITSENLLCEASDFVTDQGTYFITQDTSFVETYTLANSCDSVHTYVVTIGRVEVALPPENLCEPGTFEPNERSYYITQDTSFTETYQAANGCDSVLTYRVTVSGPVADETSENLCQPGVYTVDQRDYFITQDTSFAIIYSLANGCDSTHTYVVTVGGLKLEESGQNLCQPESFVTDQATYYITQDTSFTEVYSLVNSCDSIHTYNITVGGFRMITSEQLLCEASSFVTDQDAYYITQDTSFTETYTLANSCDSVHTYVVTIGSIAVALPPENLCEPGLFEPNERSYYITQDTIFTETYQAANGCDSVLTYRVTVSGPVADQSSENLCQPGVYAVNQQDYYITQDTSLTVIYPLANGCDSTHTYVVTVGGLKQEKTRQNLCQPELYVTDQDSYFITQDTSFKETYLLPSGCDSIQTYNITVGGFRMVQSSPLLCEASNFSTDQDDYYITQDTSFTETYTLANSCDSVHTYFVTIGRIEIALPPQNLCEPGAYQPNSLSYYITQDTSFTETYQAANGCDSVLTYRVTVTAPITGQSSANLCEPGSYRPNDRSYFITQDTVFSETLVSAVGCDSVQTYTVTVTPVVQVAVNLCAPGPFLTDQQYYQINRDTQFTERYVRPGQCDSLVDYTASLADNPRAIAAIVLDSVDCGVPNSGGIQVTGVARTSGAILTLDGRRIGFGENVTGLDVGTFELQITYPSGCVETRLVNLTQSEALIRTIIPVNNYGPLAITLDGRDLIVERDTTINEEFVNDAGCPAVRVYQINIIAIPDLTLLLDYTDLSCFGMSDGTLNITQDGTFTKATCNGLPFTTDSLLTDLPAGDYEVRLYYGEAPNEILGAQSTVKISEPDVLAPNLTQRLFATPIGEWTTIPTKGTGGTGEYKYLFWTADTLAVVNCLDCPIMELRPEVNNMAGVVMTDENGCTASDSTMVNVFIERKSFLPNAFSPNGDGINDVLTVYNGTRRGALESLQIYDRWGGLVFEAEPGEEVQTIGWDGGDYPVGDYVVRFSIRWQDDEVTTDAGRVYLIR